MSRSQHSPIRFQLEKSIWLDHHSRAAEITSLELEPEVEVVEESGMITIKGSLVLTGRFEPSEEEDEESLDLESSSLAEQLHFQPLRVEQKEIYQKEHRGKIEKKFPVDVTVPSNKVDDLEDVYVQVDQFDYTITDGHRLNIQAEVLITGVRTEANSLPLTFDVAASRDELRVEEEDVEDEFRSEVGITSEGESGTDDEGLQREFNEQIDEEEEREVLGYQETEMDDEELEGDRNDEEDQEHTQEKVISLNNHEIRTNFNSSPSEEEQDSDKENGESEGEKERAEISKTTSFLSQLMSGRNEEEDFTRLRMCIVQRDESLDTIAEKYEINIRDIMRMNRLETEQIPEGQLLYIPKS